MARNEAAHAVRTSSHSLELLWFDGCPNHEDARQMVRDVVRRVAPGTAIHDINATDPAVAARLRFPGSPTIRVDGRDVEPGFEEPADFMPLCRLNRTANGVARVPSRQWVEAALS